MENYYSISIISLLLILKLYCTFKLNVDLTTCVEIAFFSALMVEQCSVPMIRLVGYTETSCMKF